MPSSYAHLRFGQQALRRLPEPLGRRAMEHPPLCRVGFHGPDPLFYHSIFSRSALTELASRYHHIPGSELFTDLCERLRRSPQSGDFSCLMGLLTHYTLDSVCHPLICRLDAEGVCGHSELETEFDRFLLTLDGEPSPHTRDLGSHLSNDPGLCRCLARFYPPATAKELAKCLGNMTWASRILSGRGLLPRSVLEKLIPVAGETARQQLMPREENPRAAGFDQPLLALYHQALERFPGLACQLEACYRSAAPLGEDFAPIMG